MIVSLYVDDMLVTGSDGNKITKLRAKLSTQFDMKNLGEIGYFLGLEVKNMKNEIFLSQEGYTKKLVEKFRLKLCRKRSTPLDTSEKLRSDVGSLLPNPKAYHSLVGGLLYLIIIRPNIFFAVGFVSHYLQSLRSHI